MRDCCIVLLAWSAVLTSAAPIGFSREIRSILSENCYQCHGPDSTTRKAKLRLDQEADSRVELKSGARAIVPGNLEESELIHRIATTNAEERMPPAKTKKKLTPTQIALLRQWVKEGGKYEKHWSLIAPEVAPLPVLKQKGWPRNGIDHFVLARLETGGLRPSPAADKATLLRRVSFDLTGLPPTLNELDAFLTDKSPTAYEKVVDRLLASPCYGEHMARYWLDAARYADTHGFFTDDERSMWRWRDWVINAFNHNMPFDRFTVEQLAGDLLPKPTLNQRIATGFNRNHMTTRETGVIDEEYRVEYVVDRLKTTSTVWLGLSIGCARCHEHKYDPISQEEFYQLFAFFNNVPETGLQGSVGNAPPLLKIPAPDFKARLDEARQNATAAEAALKRLEPELASAQSNWEKTALANLPVPPAKGLIKHFNMEKPGQTFQPEIPRKQANEKRQAGKPDLQSGLLGMAARFDGDAVIESKGKINFDRTDPFSYGAWINSTSGSPACVLSKNDDASNLRGFDLMIRKGKAGVHLIHKWNSSAIQVMAKTSIPRNQWQHLMVTYDGSGRASGVGIYRDGEPQQLEIRHDSLQGTIRTGQPLRVGRRSTSAAFTGWIDEVRVYDRELSGDEVRRLVTSQVVRALAGVPAGKRTSGQQKMLHEFFLAKHAPPRLQQAHEKAAKLRRQARKMESDIPTSMVMQEMPKPRDTFFLGRGQYDQRGKKITAGVPVSLPTLPKGAPANRLGLARWLVDPSHPLVARVTVNRFWQQYFGTGITKTVEDLGTQGERPSHPKLLDWLAVEFIKRGWDVKHIQRLIVTSATYRQSSRVGSAGELSHDKGREASGSKLTRVPLIRMDPENRLLARGPRLRLDAEAVRDNALAISGLLVERLGGPSVKPYQPKGLWAAVSYDDNLKYQQDSGDALYRRSMYTFWKRQSPPPGMLAFDAPTREICTVRRPRTNTPLQALALMNDTTYVEASRVLARRMMTEPDESGATARIRFAFRVATARYPQPDETRILLDIFRKQLGVYRDNRKAANRLLGVGESPHDRSLNAAEHAAWTTVASIILNMDETVTKN